MRWPGILLVFYISISVVSNIAARAAPDSNSRADTVTISKIHIEGNRITRDKIILREIEFSVGESLGTNKLDSLMVKSSQNLMNRSLFNFASLSSQVIGGQCIVTVNVTERWYIWPIPIIDFADRNINAWWETKEISRLIYGIDLRFENFRGRMEYLNFIVQGGYDKKLAAKWTIPYLTKSQVFGMGILGGYQWNNEVPYALDNNKPIFYSPYKGYAQQWGFGILDFTFRQKYNFLHTLSLVFDHYQFADSLLQPDMDFAYSQPIFGFLSLGYLYKQDFRDYKPYPLNGYYLEAGLLKKGLGILSSDVDLLTLTVVFDQYIHLHKRWYFAYNLTGKFYNKNFLPYFIEPAIGYKGLEVRGYEFFVLPGQQLGVIKSNVKFEIIPRQVHRIKWIKTEKFGKIFYALYANLFFDLGYAFDHQNNPQNAMANQLLYGTGLGIDFVTYYDLVIRFEYTLNKQGYHGFYVNLVAPI